MKKIIVLFLVAFCSNYTIKAYAQDTPDTVSVTFTTVLSGIDENAAPPDINSYINYSEKTSIFNNDVKGLFVFKNTNLGSLPTDIVRVNIDYITNGGMIILIFHSRDGKQFPYPIYNNKTSVHNGTNTIRLEVKYGLIWITSNFTTSPTTTHVTVPTNAYNGEGGLWLLDMNLFKDENYSSLVDEVTPHAYYSEKFPASRQLSNVPDEEYYGYGYDDDEMLQPNQMGNGLKFDGSNDFVTINTGTTNVSTFYTVEAWVKPSVATATDKLNILSTRTDGNYFDFKLRGGNTIHADIGNTSGAWITTSADAPLNYTPNTWYHIAYVVTLNSYTIYLNGQQVGTGVFSNGTPQLFKPGSSITIGAVGNGSGENFNGTIDEVRVWNMARSQDDIQTYMYTELEGTEPGLIAYYNFNQGIACGTNTGISTLQDGSLNAKNGTLNNFNLSGTTSNWVPGFIPSSELSLCVGTSTDINNSIAGGIWSSSNSSIATIAASGKITAIAVGTAVVNYTVTNANGCTSVFTTNITVNEIPVITNIAGTKSICNIGGTTQLSSNVSNGLWSTSNTAIAAVSENGLVTGMSTGTATINFKTVNSAGCSALASTVVTVYPELTAKFKVTTPSFYFRTTANQPNTVQGVNETVQYQWYYNSAACYVPQNDIHCISYGNNKSKEWNWFGTDGYISRNVGLKVNYSNGACPVTFNTSINNGGNNHLLDIPSITASSNTICKGSAVTLSANIDSSYIYFWSTGINGKNPVGNDSTGAGNIITIIPDTTATYYVTLVDYDGHFVTSSGITITVSNVNLAANTGNALSFDGTDDYVNLGTPSAFNITNAITVEAWVKVNTFDKNWQAIVTKGDNSWRIQRNGNGNSVEFATSGVSPYSLSATKNMNDGQWHHIAGVYDGTKKYIYIDGNLDASVNATGSIAVASAPVYIGANAEQANRNFNGTIDELRIWNIARTQAQIQAAINTELLGNETGLVAYYNCNQSVEQGTASSSIFKDKTSNSINGSLNNFALAGTSSNWIAGKVATTGVSFCPNGIIKLNNSTANGIWSSSNTNVATVNANGLVLIPNAGTATISYTVTNPDGCSSTSNTQVTVYGNPTAQISAPVTTICIGSSVNMYANQRQDYTYKWSTTPNGSSIGNAPVLTVSPTVTTTYYLTIAYTTPTSTNGGSCTFSTTSSPVTITVVTPAVINNAGNALNFDGSNDYVTVTRSIQDDFTIECWIRTTQTGPSGSQWYHGFGLIDAEVAGVKNDFGLSLVGSKIAFGVGNPDYTIFSTSNVNTGSWVHVAATRSKTSGLMQLFINGTLEASYTSSNRNSLAIPTNIALGRLQTGIQYFNGSLDETRLWNTVRTQSQIQASMNTELLGTETGLMANYNFNQGIANANNAGTNSLVDKTANARNGTLNNFALSGTISNWIPGKATTSNVTMTVGSTLQLNNAASPGEWTSSNWGVATVDYFSGLVTAVSSGTATVVYTAFDAYGCYPTSNTTISVNGNGQPSRPAINNTVTSIQTAAPPIRIYPVPAHNKVTIQLPEGMQNASVSIINPLGINIVTNNTQGLLRVMNLHGLSSGVYLVKIINKDGLSYVRKLVIE